MSDALTQIKALIEELKREIHLRLNSLVVSAHQIRTSSLSEISSILGLIQSFEFRTPGNPGRNENYSGVVIKTDGIETYFEDNRTGAIEQDGDVKFGSNIDSPSTTGFHSFSNAQSYNGESMGAGDILIGDNSSGAYNIFWDSSASTLYLRSGTIGVVVLSSSLVRFGQAARYSRSNQSIANATYSSVSGWDTAFSDGFSSDGTTITVNETGQYQVYILCAWESNATGMRDVGLTVNGSPSYPIANGAGLSGFHTYLTALDELPFYDGDQLKVTVYQTSGGSLNLRRAVLSLRRVR